MQSVNAKEAPIKHDIDSCGLMSLPGATDDRGNLTFFEGTNHLPFEIQRVFYLHGVPEWAKRGCHAHRTMHEFVVPVSGKFDVELHNGYVTRRFHLDRPDIGLYISPMVWCTLTNFSAGTVCLVAASNRYDPADYIKDYPTYLAEKLMNP
jgi:hypothetical protein